MKFHLSVVIILSVLLNPLRGVAQEIKLDSISRPNVYVPRLELFKSFRHSKKDIVLLGNSITFWGEWGELLRSSHIKNRGIPGDNTFGVLERLDEVIDGKPRKVFILIGINDVSAGIPDSIIIRNYKRMITRIKEGSPRTRIYFQTLLPTNSSFTRQMNHFNKEAHILKINAALIEIAAEERITLIDIHTPFSDASGHLFKDCTWDGVHLTKKGYYIWADILKKYIN
ncbi:GDSL-type esterase/lipase family protein [Chitinophaga sp. MM2321]|uniref:GDSL-type esterase/lipase family protein n=1 Tax=Chitinophaga sp. MM2321 TaxID=3137178 RepID=UPI0032D5A83B